MYSQLSICRIKIAIKYAREFIKKLEKLRTEITEKNIITFQFANQKNLKKI